MNHLILCALALLAFFLPAPATASPPPQIQGARFDSDVTLALPAAPAGATSFRVEGVMLADVSFTAENRTRAPIPYWDARANVDFSIAGVQGAQILQRCDYDGLAPFDGLGFTGPDTRTLAHSYAIPIEIPWSTPIEQYQAFVDCQVASGVHEWWGPTAGIAYPWGFQSKVHVRLVGHVIFE